MITLVVLAVIVVGVAALSRRSVPAAPGPRGSTCAAHHGRGGSPRGEVDEAESIRTAGSAHPTVRRTQSHRPSRSRLRRRNLWAWPDRPAAVFGRCHQGMLSGCHASRGLAHCVHHVGAEEVDAERRGP